MTLLPMIMAIMVIAIIVVAAVFIITNISIMCML